MTREYAALSLRCGMLTATIDRFLGIPGEFLTFCRAESWSLSPEWLDNMKAKALESGIPQDVIDQAEREAEEVIADENLMQALCAIQAESDKKWGMQ